MNILNSKSHWQLSSLLVVDFFIICEFTHLGFPLLPLRQKLTASAICWAAPPQLYHGLSFSHFMSTFAPLFLSYPAGQSTVQKGSLHLQLSIYSGHVSGAQVFIAQCFLIWHNVLLLFRWDLHVFYGGFHYDHLTCSANEWIFKSSAHNLQFHLWKKMWKAVLLLYFAE